MTFESEILRATRTLAPREALRVADQPKSQRNLSGDTSDRKGEDPAGFVAVSQRLPTLDCTKAARVTARALLAREFESVRAGIKSALNENSPLAERLGGVHLARRGLKRLQALRALLQPGFPRGRSSARIGIRRAKESLAEARQRDALGLLLEELCALRGAPLTSDSSGTLNQSRGAPSSKSMQEALDSVTLAERSMRLCSGAPLDWHEVVEQFAMTWRRGRLLARRAWLGLGESDLHEMRKRFQRIADQMAALQGCIDDDRFVARKRLRIATDNLGRARDLALLADKIEGTTAEGRALARRALALRTRAVRSARDQSRLALRATSLQMSTMMNQRIQRR